MHQKFTSSLLLLSLLYMTGCSSLAYVSGYNMVSDREIVITAERPGKSVTCPACGFTAKEQNPAEPFLCPHCGYSDAKYSETAYVIAMVETGGGYLRKSPTLVVGMALSPIFFVVGAISGAFDSGEEGTNPHVSPGEQLVITGN